MNRDGLDLQIDLMDVPVSELCGYIETRCFKTLMNQKVLQTIEDVNALGHTGLRRIGLGERGVIRVLDGVRLWRLDHERDDKCPKS